MIVRLTENKLINIIKKVLSEQIDTLGLSDKQGFGEKPSSGIFNYSGVEFFACQKSPCKLCARYNDVLSKYKIRVESVWYTGGICLKSTFVDGGKFKIIDNVDKEFSLSIKSLSEVAQKIKEKDKEIKAVQSTATVILNKTA